jgi:hypothetical protein
MKRRIRQAVATREKGMTMLGMLILIAFVGLFAFAFLRLTPVYLNYMKVAGVVDGVREEFDGQGPTRSAIRSSISRRFDIESISEITAREVDIATVDGGFEVTAEYEHKAPFIANVAFVVDFKKTAYIRR